MWVFTQHGFISAVQHFDKKSAVVVRARDKKALARIAELYDLEIKNTPENDYPYRVLASREQFARYLMDEVAALNYTNFKDRLHYSRGDNYYYAASQVWDTMHDVEDATARRRGRAGV